MCNLSVHNIFSSIKVTYERSVALNKDIVLYCIDYLHANGT